MQENKKNEEIQGNTSWHNPLKRIHDDLKNKRIHETQQI